MNAKDLTAYCGLYCGDCIRYKSKASALAGELFDEIANLHISEYAKVKQVDRKEFENFDAFISTLKAILEIKCDLPCRLGGDGCSGSCKIIKCVTNKAIKGCWECDDFEKCEKFNFLKPFHGENSINNLRKIKKYGLYDWAKHREKCYPWL